MNEGIITALDFVGHRLLYFVVMYVSLYIRTTVIPKRNNYRNCEITLRPVLVADAIFFYSYETAFGHSK